MNRDSQPTNIYCTHITNKKRMKQVHPIMCRVTTAVCSHLGAVARDPGPYSGGGFAAVAAKVGQR